MSVAFAVSTWALIQIFEVLFPIFNVPQWGLKLAVLVLVIGYPITLILSWLKEIKLKKQILEERQDKTKRQFFFRQLAFDFLFIGLLSVGMGYLAMFLLDSIEQEQLMDEIVDVSDAINEVPINPKSVAILPFTINDDTELPDYLLKSFSNELSTVIANQTNFNALSQRAILQYADETELNRLVERLGARYFIEGYLTSNDFVPDGVSTSTVQKNGSSISASLKLSISIIDTQSFAQIWSQVISEETIVSLQSALQTAVVSALNQLISSSTSSPKTEPANNLNDIDIEAYDDYIHAKNILLNATELEQFDIAEQYLIKALSNEKDFLLASSALCQTYIEKFERDRSPGTYQMADKVCSETLTGEVYNPEPITAMANLMRISGQYTDSIDYFKKAIVLNQNYLPAVIGLAQAYIAIDDPVNAESYLHKAIALEPGYWQNYQYYGDFLFTTAQYDRAIKQYKTLLFLNPRHALTLNRLGASYYLSNNFSEAINYWQQALTIQPEPFIYSNLGTAAFFNQNFSLAVESYQKAVNAQPSDAVFWANLADAQKFNGLIEESVENYSIAINLLRKQLAINPNDKTVKSMLARSLSELNQCTEAKAIFNEINNEQTNDTYLLYDTAIMQLNCKNKETAISLITQAIVLGYSFELVKQDVQFKNIVNEVERNLGQAIK
ncbi:MAG: tetratricopeptide repeat protein [Kangiellaceae bacterium]|nr:tetratricopeptide repeat protein [Kangiellaceae bacterium]